MKPEDESKTILGITASKAAMYEYGVPEKDHIKIPENRDPADLFPLSIGMLGDLAASINEGESFTEETIESMQKELIFAANFFDKYIASRLNEDLNPELLLLGSASYYLANFAGSSMVLANTISKDNLLHIKAGGLEVILHAILNINVKQREDELTDTYVDEQPDIKNKYNEYIDTIPDSLQTFFTTGNGEEQLLSQINSLIGTAIHGTPKELLFADVIGAMIRKRIENSTWKSLPNYSGLPLELWKPTLARESFVKELWPAQKLLGESGVFNGTSAVIQMPTSAGKTTAVDFIIRSAFMAGRAELAIVVAPFVALVHEIKGNFEESFVNDDVDVTEFSDVIQTDFQDKINPNDNNRIIVTTPEKLLYVLRHTPDLADEIGLLVYDEGHQFDSGQRGVTYELLLTSLKGTIPEGIQTILISAVISNANDIGDWLIDQDNKEIIEGKDLLPTQKSIAFASWKDRIGRIEVRDTNNPDTTLYFIPRIIQQMQILKTGRERNERFFPEKNSDASTARDVALYMGLKVVNKGSVAIFCGKKDAAARILERGAEVFLKRSLDMQKPAEFADPSEIARFTYLYEQNFGENSYLTEAASLGLFGHHGNTPNGIRVAVEYGMQESHINLVVCTSTLAQGVNLPIRYLMIHGTSQGQNSIAVRDFHNLMGRVGRAGKHTTGSIIFTDPRVFDERIKPQSGSNRWDDIKFILDPANSEQVTSSILNLIAQVETYSNSYQYSFLNVLQNFIQDEDLTIQEIIEEYAERAFALDRKNLKRVLLHKLTFAESIESYLMHHWEELNSEMVLTDVANLARKTLAYHLAKNDEAKDDIVNLFILLAQNIQRKTYNDTERSAFGKTMYGVDRSVEFKSWVQEYINELIATNETPQNLLPVIWKLFEAHLISENSDFGKWTKPDLRLEFIQKWVEGETFETLFTFINDNDINLPHGQYERKITIDSMIGVTVNDLGYNLTLGVNGIITVLETITITDEIKNQLITNLQTLQKRIKYGLSNEVSIILYELGFGDRVVSQDLANSLFGQSQIITKRSVVIFLRENTQVVQTILDKYPAYYSNNFQKILQLES